MSHLHHFPCTQFPHTGGTVSGDLFCMEIDSQPLSSFFVLVWLGFGFSRQRFPVVLEPVLLSWNLLLQSRLASASRVLE